ncbi:MAG: hypothetical protein H0W15_05380 [Gemmatimonadales bacterium]|nr:hypothetical protein [Gemmatimonadales bacterium]
MALPAQSRIRVTPMARGIATVTRMAPSPLLEPVTEARLVQPMVMIDVAVGERLHATISLNAEGLTIPGGQLTAGGWGEGFVDRRHPHTYVHELMFSARDLLGPVDGSARLALAAGKGFVPFGTDDPMSRPMLMYPVNHHLSQILERAVAIAQFKIGPVVAEASVFNGDEPTEPGDWPLLLRDDGNWRFGDSWAGRLTLRPVHQIEAQASYADVHSPEHRAGAGGEARKASASVRWHDAPAWGERYAMVEWARTSELDGFFVFHSMLAEVLVRRRRIGAAYRFERTERPEEERVADPFRSRRPHLENAILGITRWTLHTIRAEYDATDPDGRVQLTPFVELTTGRVAEVSGGVFDVVSTYGSNRAGTLSVGVVMGWRSRSHRMGRYGVLAPDHAGMTPHKGH